MTFYTEIKYTVLEVKVGRAGLGVLLLMRKSGFVPHDYNVEFVDGGCYQ